MYLPASSDKTESVQVDNFYRVNKCRLHVCPGDRKHPTEIGYAHSNLLADDVAGMLAADPGLQRYCWIHGENHLVLDVDCHGEVDGRESFVRLCEDIGVDLEAACGAIVRTPTGGFHLCWQYEPRLWRSLRSLISIDPQRYAGLDTMGGAFRSNSLTIAVGSTHPSAPGRYEWATPQPQLVNAPTELLAFLQDSGGGSGSANGSATTHRVAGGRKGEQQSDSPGDAFNFSWDGVERVAEAMTLLGYQFRWVDGDSRLEFVRPGKTTGSERSGHLGTQSGTGRFCLTSYSLSDPLFPSGESISILEAMCRILHSGRSMMDPASSRATISQLLEWGFGRRSGAEQFADWDPNWQPAGAGPPVGAGSAGPAGSAGGWQMPEPMTEEFWNHEWVANRDGKGKKRVGHPLGSLIDRMKAFGWPAVCNGVLFGPTRTGRIQMMDSTASLFAWLQAWTKVCWAEGAGCVGKAEFHAALLETVPEYEAICEAPHFPPIPGVFYTRPEPPQGSVEDLWQFVDQFLPESEVDRLLIAAALVTPFWGGPGGARPMFCITSKDAQGAGKSTLVQAIARLVGQGVPRTHQIRGRKGFEALESNLASQPASNPSTPRMITIDNWRGALLGASDVEALITEEHLSLRKLYVGEVQVPNLFSWFVTGSAVSMSEDLSQRSVEIRICKPERYDADWDRRLAGWDMQRLLGGVAAFFAQPARPIAESTRFGRWTSDILGRIPGGELAVRAILERNASMSSAEDETNEVREWILSYRADVACRVEIPVVTIEGREHQVIRMHDMVAWLVDKKIPCPFGRWTSRGLGHLVKSVMHRIPELEAVKKEKFRGYVWQTND